MNEKETSEQFNRELDELLSGRVSGVSLIEPDIMKTAEKLSRADFSADSGIRELLRAELLARGRKISSLKFPESIFRRNVIVRLAIAAACFLLILLPVKRLVEKTGKPESGPAIPVTTLPTTHVFSDKKTEQFPSVPAGNTGSSLLTQAVPKQVRTTDSGTAALRPQVPEAMPTTGIILAAGSGLFHSVPVKTLFVSHKADFPIETKKGSSPIVRLKGSKLVVPNGSGVKWETEHAVFIIETRRISPEEFFRRKAL